MGKNETEVTDVRALLAQKEKDLILAAELGKALLEKNEDLSQQNEKMTEEFSKQLEVRPTFCDRVRQITYNNNMMNQAGIMFTYSTWTEIFTYPVFYCINYPVSQYSGMHHKGISFSKPD